MATALAFDVNDVNDAETREEDEPARSSSLTPFSIVDMAFFVAKFFSSVVFVPTQNNRKKSATETRFVQSKTKRRGTTPAQTTQPNVKKKRLKAEKKRSYSPHADARVRGPQIDPDGWSFRFRGHD